VLVTHDQDEALSTADRVAVLRDAAPRKKLAVMSNRRVPDRRLHRGQAGPPPTLGAMSFAPCGGLA
jgi:ABC-type nitrate/sulfonate/bicarbonate transport system ATPase subunit